MICNNSQELVVEIENVPKNFMKLLGMVPELAGGNSLLKLRAKEFQSGRTLSETYSGFHEDTQF